MPSLLHRQESNFITLYSGKICLFICFTCLSTEAGVSCLSGPGAQSFYTKDSGRMDSWVG